MAIFAVITGGLFGFVSFLAALLIFDLGFLAALGIYSASGTLLSIAIIALTCLTQTIAARMPVPLHRQDASSEQF